MGVFEFVWRPAVLDTRAAARGWLSYPRRKYEVGTESTRVSFAVTPRIVEPNGGESRLGGVPNSEVRGYGWSPRASLPFDEGGLVGALRAVLAPLRAVLDPQRSPPSAYVATARGDAVGSKAGSFRSVARRVLWWDRVRDPT